MSNKRQLYNGTFCTAVTDIANNSMRITAASNPHVYIDTFANIMSVVSMCRAKKNSHLICLHG